jgi:glycosidase
MTQMTIRHHSAAGSLPSGTPPPTFEFHIARDVRAKYDFDAAFFSITGNVILADFRAVRDFVGKLNALREPEDRVSAGRVNAAGLMDEIFHHLFRVYESEANPGVFRRALARLETAIGAAETRGLLLDFTVLFPPRDVYAGKTDPAAYLEGKTGGRPNAEITLEELVLLSLANFNPANAKLIELFDERYFSDRELYAGAISELERFFREEPGFGPRNQDILALFKSPILLHPDDLEAQLEYIRDQYGPWLGDVFIRRLLSGADLIKEDRFPWTGGPGGPPTAVPRYRGSINGAERLTLGKSGYRYASESWKDYREPENFTEDTNWMPRVVLLAKNCSVWLDQLAKQYGRPIQTLDQVPDEELDKIAGWNFNSLWLIGIWERSGASRRIKHLMGNIDAVSSAYSVYDYRVADDLGGEAAFQNLNERAKARGIRLASDMVPNHTGIFSQWVLDHPEYFIQTSYPPFPGYRFTGPDLSEDPSIQLRIEDGYWNRRDAAVAFQRIDNRTGEIRYIYHGNDGTNMPWNDTAQLDMLRSDVREAVIRKIFDIARRFSIIRFDAAMTLTKRHFARLWYPEPGGGGDIPSRSDFAMTKIDFERAFPEEFWREVVDRINAEMPDTLLLAEAFWLLEGYFVRTLGMHRVYNSAFMHMMMKEENAKYRDLLSETLEFEPEILRRYVSFMSNPDEETAIRQFGTDDKYFGVCVLLVTLPGLPLFAHGQIEGLTEKYGMEYRRAYYHETPNTGLIERHEREIFPLMQKRFLFSPVAHFWLFDAMAADGSVNENVFAFVNRERGERALVLYNNKYERASGRIFRSSPKLTASPDAPKGLETRTIAEALGLNPSPGHYYLYRDSISGLEYIRSGSDAAGNGIEVELDGFKYRVYLDWREVYDETGDWEKLARRLGRRGVPDIRRAFEESRLEPVHRAFEAVVQTAVPLEIAAVGSLVAAKDETETAAVLEERFAALIRAIQDHFRLETDSAPAAAAFHQGLAGTRALRGFGAEIVAAGPRPPDRDAHPAIRFIRGAGLPADGVLFLSWLTMASLALLFPEVGALERRRSMEALWLDTPLKKVFGRLGRGEFETSRSLTLLAILRAFAASASGLFRASGGGWPALLADDGVRAFLGVNEFEGVWYYSKENFEELVDWLFALAVLSEPAAEGGGAAVETARSAFRRRGEILDLSLRADYRLDALRNKLGPA